jgi:hypothetical protein
MFWGKKKKTVKLKTEYKENRLPCKFCDPVKSFGNTELLKKDDIEVFIANEHLYALYGDGYNKRFSESVDIDYCPKCGRKFGDKNERDN